MTNTTKHTDTPSSRTVADTFDQADFFPTHRVHTRPDPLLSVINKLLAFACGCLVSVGFGLLEVDFSAMPHAQLKPSPQFQIFSEEAEQIHRPKQP